MDNIHVKLACIGFGASLYFCLISDWHAKSWRPITELAIISLEGSVIMPCLNLVIPSILSDVRPELLTIACGEYVLWRTRAPAGIKLILAISVVGLYFWENRILEFVNFVKS